VALLDVILGYDCNLACDYCTITLEMRQKSLPTRAVLQAMARARAEGYDCISFTGGEPTIRNDLLGLVRAARAHGFADVKVQSNGLVYAHARNVDAMIDAGVSRFHVSIHTHREDAYDRLVRRDGSYSLMEAGLRQLVARGVVLVVDVILKSDTYRDLPAALAWLHARGVRAVHLWYVSLTDGNRDNVESLPRMSEAVPVVRSALAWAREHGLDVRSLHIPRCLLGDDSHHAYDPGADRVQVVSPEATFELRDSRLAGRVHVPACAGCRWEDICPGIRPDYLECFGDAEIAAARGQDSRVAPTRRLPLHHGG
jgi:cyclic pyranopterin phosphate synthase